jgi:hypothetical protein
VDGRSHSRWSGKSRSSHGLTARLPPAASSPRSVGIPLSGIALFALRLRTVSHGFGLTVLVSVSQICVGFCVIATLGRAPALFKPRFCSAPSFRLPFVMLGDHPTAARRLLARASPSLGARCAQAWRARALPRAILQGAGLMGQLGSADEAHEMFPAYRSGREFDEELIGRLDVLPELWRPLSLQTLKPQADDFLAFEERLGGAALGGERRSRCLSAASPRSEAASLASGTPHGEDANARASALAPEPGCARKPSGPRRRRISQ